LMLEFVTNSYSDDRESLKYQNFKIGYVEYRGQCC
jgi:hypothetical protein